MDHVSFDEEDNKLKIEDESNRMKSVNDIQEDLNLKLESNDNELPLIMEPAEDDDENLGNLSLRLESDEDELPSLSSIMSSRSLKSRPLSSILPTFSDEESSDSDHYTKGIRQKLDKLKKTTEECERRQQSDYLASRSKLYGKNGRSILKRSSKFLQNSSKRERSDSDVDGSTYAPLQARNTKIGRARKRVCKSGSDSSESHSRLYDTCDKWLSKDTTINSQVAKESKIKIKPKFSSDIADTSVDFDTDLDIDNSSPITVQKRPYNREGIEEYSGKRKRPSVVASNSDEENKSPEKGRPQGKTKSIASILTEERRMSLNVTSDKCDFRRWVSDCKQIEERRRTLAKSLSKSSQSDGMEQSILEDVFENGKIFVF